MRVAVVAQPGLCHVLLVGACAAGSAKVKLRPSATARRETLDMEVSLKMNRSGGNRRARHAGSLEIGGLRTARFEPIAVLSARIAARRAAGDAPRSGRLGTARGISGAAHGAAPRSAEREAHRRNSRAASRTGGADAASEAFSSVVRTLSSGCRGSSG